jgi:hypothetical protein
MQIFFQVFFDKINHPLTPSEFIPQGGNKEGKFFWKDIPFLFKEGAWG